MRRTDREITNRDEILDILQRTDTIRLGINGDPFPYVVPLSFGFEDCDGEVRLYFHGAKEGFKHTLLDKNNHVCVEADIFHHYIEKGITASACYESVIGFGIAEVVHEDEAAKGLDLVCAHCGYPNYTYDKSVLDRMRIYKVTLSSMTGKGNVS
ncbi:MAG: pyridoxamine 5'-phosphate oxidase family protein [Defluviitaleaceae bacterium]|nr:pyridoxamine 5'-phosphate oxidase family protein [Defluviitaleaceae bacterium]